MDVIEQMLHKGLRDDSTATIGLRALLGHSATPWGVYHANMPANPVFTSSKKYVTHYFLTGEFDTSLPSMKNYATIVKQETYQITVWGGDTTTSNAKILDRIRYVLEGKHLTTDPTSDAAVLAIKCEWEGPELYDEDYRIYYRNTRFRVWVQDDTIK